MRHEINAHQNLQLLLNTGQGPSLSSPDYENPFTEAEERRPAGRSLPLHVSSRNAVSSADRTAASTEQCLIPRKPVGSGQPIERCQPRGGTQPIRISEQVERNQAVERGQKSTPKFESTQTSVGRAQIFKNWWMEMSACLLFNTALVAIIATLYPHQGKPLPDWPYRLSVNTLVSIYGVVLKGTILLVTAEGLGQLKWRWLQDDRPLGDLVNYDQATRGPIGALTLLWRLRLRHPLSSVGALLTLVVLAVDPFTQQIIHYYECSVPMSGLLATIPRTNIYLQRDWNQSEAMNGWIEPGLQAAISNGILSPKKLVDPGCLTGNCTFKKEYGTVGYCSSCEDVTKDLIIRSAIVKSNYTGVMVGEFISSNGTKSSEIPDNQGIRGNTNVSVSTSLPSGLSVSSYPGTKFNLTAMQVFRQPNGSEDEYRVEMIVGRQFQLFDPATGHPPSGCGTAATNDTWYCKGYGAASCSLSPCVRTYTSTIEAGELHETQVSTSNSTKSSWGHLVPPPLQIYIPYLGMIDTVCLCASERQSLLKAGYHLDPSTRWLAYNLTFDPTTKNISSNASFPESMLFNECIYILDNLFVSTLWDAYLKDVFQGTVEGDAGRGDTIEVLRGSQVLQSIYNYGGVSFDRVNSTFQNISESITSFFRQNSISKYNDPAKGVVMHDRTCLSVRWAWLTYPSALVLLALLFFVVVVIDTRPMGNRAPIWKSSPLALIFHGPELPDKYQMGIGNINDMEEFAKGVIVRLGNKEKGLDFVGWKVERVKEK